MINYNTDAYTQQICDQYGMTPTEVRASARPATINIDVARQHGFDTVEAYEEALWDFMAGQ